MNYVDTLNQAWQLHLAPRAENALTVVSTFAGCGGSSLGYSIAGYRELLAVEWDDNAVQTFKLNFPGIPVYHGDIAKLSVDECLQLAGIKPCELDVLDGSPPCQGFSTAGKRVMDDPRNQLFREYVRLLRGLRPKVFVMENVSGMVKGKMKLIFADILRELKASSYKVSARLMNAMYFNVPQSRQRMIFIGVRDDLGIEPSHPKAQASLITVREAFDGVNEDGTEVAYPEWLLNASQEIKRRETTGDRSKAAAFIKYKGTSGSSQGYVRLDWDKPCTTLCKEFISVAFQGHPDDKRFINQSECRRIASYSDDFVFVGKFRKEVIKRLGNSVPPLFMAAIATHIRREILERWSQETGKTPELITN